MLLKPLIRLFDNFLSGDFIWGKIRLVGILLIGLVFLASSAFGWSRQEADAIAASWQAGFFLLRIIPTPLLWLPAAVFTSNGIRFIFFPTILMVIVISAAAKYVQEIYELKSMRLALRYLLPAIFGINYPVLEIKDQETSSAPADPNPLNIIGGPGYLFVHPGRLVVLERTGARPQVVGEGFHKVNRFRTVKEVIPLDKQEDVIESARALSWDGIRVEVKNIRYHFSLEPAEKLENYSESYRDPVELYEESALKMVYRRTISPRGRNSWVNTLRFVIDGAITDWIFDHRLDDLTSPSLVGGIPQVSPSFPRPQIRAELLKESLANQLRRFGAQLHWFDMGHFKVVDGDVDKQRLAVWQAWWDAKERIALSESEATSKAEIEIARASYQAKIITEIMNAMQAYPLGATNQEKLRKIFLFCTARVIDAVSRSHVAALEQLPKGKTGS
jgi:hypothetical protein